MDATRAWESEHNEWLLKYRKWQEEHFLWQQQQKLLLHRSVLSPTMQQLDAPSIQTDILHCGYSGEHRATPVHQRLKRSFSSPLKAALAHLNSLKSPLRGVSGSTSSSSSGRGSRFAAAAATVAKQGLLKTGQALGNVIRRGATLRNGTCELVRRQEELQRQVMEQREILMQLQQKQNSFLNTVEPQRICGTTEAWHTHTRAAGQCADSVITDDEASDSTVHIMPEVDASIDWIVNVGMNPKAQAVAALALRQKHQVRGSASSVVQQEDEILQKGLGTRLKQTKRHPEFHPQGQRSQKMELFNKDVEASSSSSGGSGSREDNISFSRNESRRQCRRKCSIKSRRAPILDVTDARRKNARNSAPAHKDHLCYGDICLDSAI